PFRAVTQGSLGGNVICPNCGVENRAEARFCDGCGSALARVCPTCGSTLRPQARFCDTCGTAVGDGQSATRTPATMDAPRAASAVPAHPVTERRLVSVLFADLVGFTTLSESKDSEEVRDLLSRYFDASRRVISQYGGNVEKFIGDAVMAVW